MGTNYKPAIDKRIQFLEDIINRTNSTLQSAPQGKLRATKHKNKYQYYHRSRRSDKNGKYIPIADFELAKKLAQKEYNQAFLSQATSELTLLKQLADHYKSHDIDEIKGTLPAGKQLLVTPIIQSQEDFMSSWLSQSYVPNPHHAENLLYENNRGIMMRSKSEVIISALLDKMSIPYLYEKPLNLGGKIIYPDFTILDTRKRTEIYLEHLGMMDDIDYAANAHKKISTYENHGYYLGEKLIITYETQDAPLNIKLVKDKLEKLLL